MSHQGEYEKKETFVVHSLVEKSNSKLTEIWNWRKLQAVNPGSFWRCSVHKHINENICEMLEEVLQVTISSLETRFNNIEERLITYVETQWIQFRFRCRIATLNFSMGFKKHSVQELPGIKHFSIAIQFLGTYVIVMGTRPLLLQLPSRENSVNWIWITSWDNKPIITWAVNLKRAIACTRPLLLQLPSKQKDTDYSTYSMYQTPPAAAAAVNSNK